MLKTVKYLIFYCMGKLVLGKLLLGKLVTGEVSVGEVAVGEIVDGKLRWGSNLTPIWDETDPISIKGQG